MIGDCAKGVLNCGQIHSEWQAWLNCAFQHSQTHNALLHLLLNGIKDQRFVEESIIYGKSLVSHAVLQQMVVDASISMTFNVLIAEPRVVIATLDLCKRFVMDSTVYELTRDFMQKVCLRDDVYDIMMWQMACASSDGIAGLSPDDTPVRNAMQ